jgi:hypothetical protein
MGKLRGTVIAIALASLLVGCSSFNRDWKSTLKQPIPQSGLAGPWEGHWISDVNGHNGRLRCLITPVSTNLYEAHFHAKYRRILSFAYEVPLQVEQVGERFTFSGEADLGKLAGGVYKYEGVSTPTNFFSTYNSKHDHGKFEMQRPKRR